LAFSLADVIATSVSSLESLVVRSSLAAARFASDVPDLPAIARELNVDVVLTGTLLRADDQLRAIVQLVDAPAGTLVGYLAGSGRRSLSTSGRSLATHRRIAGAAAVGAGAAETQSRRPVECEGIRVLPSSEPDRERSRVAGHRARPV